MISTRRRSTHAYFSLYRPDSHCHRHLARRHLARRRGVAAVEMAILLLVFLTLVIGMLDVGLAVFRYHVMAEVARVGARQAIVHGKEADRLGSWGPASFEGTGGDSHPIPTTLRTALGGMNLDEVTLKTEWPDGNNLLETQP